MHYVFSASEHDQLARRLFSIRIENMIEGERLDSDTYSLKRVWVCISKDRPAF